MLYIVTSAEETPDYGVATFVHLVTKSEEEAKAKLRKIVDMFGYQDLQPETEDGLEDSVRRYDADGLFAHVEDDGTSFEVEVRSFDEKTLKPVGDKRL